MDRLQGGERRLELFVHGVVAVPVGRVGLVALGPVETGVERVTIEEAMAVLGERRHPAGDGPACVGNFL